MVKDEEQDAALALARWDELQHAPEAEARGRRRFRRRAFERARDRALQALAMHLTPSMLRRMAARRGTRVRLQRPRRDRVGSGRRP
jgi:hypothetical protein